jgi:hypothetical protein
MIVVSFYTDDEIYKPLGLQLIEQLKKYDMEYDIEEIENKEISKNNWINLVIYKPLFMKKMMEKHKKNIVWIDVDTIINEYPKFLFDYENTEIELAYLARPKPFLAIVYCKYNSKMIEFLERFGNQCKKDVQYNKRKINRGRWYEGDQPTLVNMDTTHINFHSFPTDVISKIEEKRNTIFVETQASRILRKQING